MAQTTSLVFNGGVIPSPSPAPSGSGKAKLLKTGEITITEQGVQVTKKVICDPDSVTSVAPFMEVLTSAKLAELVNANSILVLAVGDMQYLMASASITVENDTPVCTAVNFLGLSNENKLKVAYECTRITDELTFQQVIEVGEPVETNLKRVAFTGSYNDLSDKPSIPAQEQSDWNEADSSKVDYIKNKPNLALKENVLNKVQTIDPASEMEYPSSKAVADFISQVATVFNDKIQSGLNTTQKRTLGYSLVGTLNVTDLNKRGMMGFELYCCKQCSKPIRMHATFGYQDDNNLNASYSVEASVSSELTRYKLAWRFANDHTANAPKIEIWLIDTIEAGADQRRCGCFVHMVDGIKWIDGDQSTSTRPSGLTNFTPFDARSVGIRMTEKVSQTVDHIVTDTEASKGLMMIPLEYVDRAQYLLNVQLYARNDTQLERSRVPVRISFRYQFEGGDAWSPEHTGALEQIDNDGPWYYGDSILLNSNYSGLTGIQLEVYWGANKIPANKTIGVTITYVLLYEPSQQ